MQRTEFGDQVVSWLKIKLLWLFHMPGATCIATQNIHTNLARILEWVMVKPSQSDRACARHHRTCSDFHRVLFSANMQMWLTILWWIPILSKTRHVNDFTQIYTAVTGYDPLFSGAVRKGFFAIRHVWLHTDVKGCKEQLSLSMVGCYGNIFVMLFRCFVAPSNDQGYRQKCLTLPKVAHWHHMLH